MLRNSISALLFLLLALPVLSLAQVPPRPVTHAAAVQQDLQRLDLRDLPAEEGSAWVAAHITLTGDRAARVVGEYIDGETGKMVATGGPITSVSTVAGRCDVCDVLIGKLAMLSWTFSWERPRPHSGSGGHGPPPNQGIAEGAFVLQVFPNRQNSQQLGQRYAIPDDWQKQAKPAFDYLQAHADVFQGPSMPEQAAVLQKLVSGDNPLLSIAAARALAKTGQMDADFLGAQVLISREYKQAALCDILAGSLRAAQSEEALGKITAYIRAAQSPIEVKGLVLALQLFADRDRSQPHLWGSQMLGAVQANPDVIDQSNDGRFNAEYVKGVADAFAPRAPRTAVPTPARGN